MTTLRWQRTLSGAVLLWIGTVVVMGAATVHLWVLSLLLALFFTGFYLRFGGRATPANIVTTVRTAAAVGLLIAAPFVFAGVSAAGVSAAGVGAAGVGTADRAAHPGAYLFFAVALIAALTDFIDGILARREERAGTGKRSPGHAPATAGEEPQSERAGAAPGEEPHPPRAGAAPREEPARPRAGAAPGEKPPRGRADTPPSAAPLRFGAVWDAETDAAFMLALSAIVFACTPIGGWVLAIGGIRYLFGLLFILVPEEPAWPRSFTRFSKTVCAISVGTLVGALYPTVDGTLAVAANSIALALLVGSFGWEAVLRSGGPGMLRTLVIYYGIPFRQRRLRRLYGRFIRRGDLAFDLGAHVGNRVRAWRRLGAQAVAVEPQPSCLKVLRALYRRSSRIHIEPVAVGASEGTQTLYICDDYPTLSTVSATWIDEVKQVETFSHINWNRRVDVPVRTLDSLIDQYGVPSFVKIDVEGHEPEVLSGLSRALPALSFEFLPASMDGALRCIDMLEALGTYEYNYAMVETARLREPAWVDAATMREILRRMPLTGASGDVYARLSSSPDRG